MMVEDALKDGGYEPAIAGSGEEALTLLKAFRTKYSALVTDIRLLGRLDAGPDGQILWWALAD